MTPEKQLPTDAPSEDGYYFATEKRSGERLIVGVRLGPPSAFSDAWPCSFRFDGGVSRRPMSDFEKFVPCIDPLAEPRA